MQVETNMEKHTTNPLVSIIVITYNSSKYVLETLESAKAQSYQNIELIVSDDFSIDNTVEICRKWIEENKSRFVRTELITASANTGIPVNCNRGVSVAKGEWVKLIAGDDILLNDCISNAMDFAKNNKRYEIFASNMIYFKEDINIGINKVSKLDQLEFFNNKTDAKKQFDILIFDNPVPAPSVFIFRQLLIAHNGFDESINQMEDYPFWLKVTQSGHKIGLMNKITVGYRLSSNSISGHTDDNLFNKFYKHTYQFKKQFTFKYLNHKKRFDLTYMYFVQYLFDRLNINHMKYKTLYYIALRMNLLKYFN